MIEKVIAELNDRGVEATNEYPGVVHIIEGDYWTSDCNETWTVDCMDGDIVLWSEDTRVPSAETDPKKIVDGILEAIRR